MIIILEKTSVVVQAGVFFSIKTGRSKNAPLSA